MKTTALPHLEKLSDQATAPFYEHHPIRKILEITKENPRSVNTTLKENGTIDVHYRGRGNDKPKMGMTAHIDHPGWIVQLLPDGTYSARLEGGYSEEQCLGADVLLHDHLHDGRARGEIVEKFEGEHPEGVLYRIETTHNKGHWSFATPDLEAFSIHGDRISGRVMDDFAGVSIGLATIARAAKEKIPIDLLLRIYRAEESSFIGLYDEIMNQQFEADRVMYSLETSSNVAREGGKKEGKLETIAQVGRGGPIIRTGDKRFVYDPDAIRLLEDAAKGINGPVRTKRMTGGVSDAALMQSAGSPAGGVIATLQNYHNGLYNHETFVPEEISLRELEGAVDLMVSAANVLVGDPERFVNRPQQMMTPDACLVIAKIHQKWEGYKNRGMLRFSL
ncbi:MAG: hypothetical protein ABIH34_01895 [Nanoarchaeota archaeon]